MVKQNRTHIVIQDIVCERETENVHIQRTKDTELKTKLWGLVGDAYRCLRVKGIISKASREESIRIFLDFEKSTSSEFEKDSGGLQKCDIKRFPQLFLCGKSYGSTGQISTQNDF